MTNEVVHFRKAAGAVCTAENFPLTPLETWYVMRGYAVRPKKPVSMETFPELPERFEVNEGFIMLRKP